ncbi:MAG TPA: enoyl-CoA hydratase/isomerase family protein [Roseiarcus sp.]
MTKFEEYAKKYSRVRMERDDNGILEVTLHTNGGTMVFGPEAHEQLPPAFLDISQDPDNKIVILTGTGDSFIEEVETATLKGTPGKGSRLPNWTKMDPHTWDRTFTNAKTMLVNLLNIEAPVIAAVNGPVNIHADLAVLSDIVIAAEHASFQDAPHFPNGLVFGDGCHIVWPHLLGANRGKYFLLTGQKLSAKQALDLGVVNEVLPKEQVLPRARELAQQLLQQPPLTVRYARILMTQDMRRMMTENLSHGLALTGLAANAYWPNS